MTTQGLLLILSFKLVSSAFKKGYSSQSSKPERKKVKYNSIAMFYQTIDRRGGQVILSMC
jgi:hypothetical protein